VLLALVIALAAAVRLHRLDAHSLWLDEAYTYMRAAMEPADGIEASIKKGHVPTYFLFMHHWLAFGDDERWLRMPSVIFGVLTVLAAYVLGRVLGGNRVGLGTALLVALSPLQVRYAQEARMYTMLTFAATLAITGVIWLLKHPQEAGVPLWRRTAWTDGPPGRARRWSWLAFVAGAIAVLYLHNTGVFFLVTCSLCSLVLIATARGRRWAVIGNWTLANLAVLAAWSFWIRTLLVQTERVAKEFWPDFPTLRTIQLTFRQLYLYVYQYTPWINVLLATLFVLGLIALRKQARLAVGLSLLAFAPPALVLLVSLLKPMFITRIMLWAPIPCFALMAAGMFAVPFRPLPYVLAGALLYAGRVGLDDYYHGYSGKPPWRKIALILHEQYDKKTRIFTSGSQERTSLQYYWKRRSDPIPAVPTSVMYGRNAKRILKLARGFDTVIILDYKKGKRYSTKVAMRELDTRATLTMKKRLGGVMLFRYDMTKKPKAPETAAPPEQAVPWPGPLPDPAIGGIAPALRGGAMSDGGIAPALRGGAMSVASWPGPLADPLERSGWPGPLSGPIAPPAPDH
jgi:hypothetical protein